MLFSDGTRTALVISSLLTLFPIGIISLVFWILVSTQLHCYCHWKRCFEHLKKMYLFVSLNQLLTHSKINLATQLAHTPSLFIHPSIHPSIHRSLFLGTGITDAKLNLFFFLVGTKGWINGTQEEGSRKLSRGRKHGSDVNFVWIVCHTNYFNLHSTVKGRRCQVR